MAGAGAVLRAMRIVAVLAMACLAALATTAGTASACSCATPDARSWLPRVDGAIVGRLVERRVEGGRATHVFRVFQAVKGRFGTTVEVVTSSSGAACGLELRVGQTTGLLLDRSNGRWESNLCWQVDPDRLRAAARPLPAPNGRGPAAFLVAGRFGPHSTLALDERGRTLAYGRGSGSVLAFGVCPGSRLAVELVDGRRPYLAVRTLPRLRIVGRRSLGVTLDEASPAVDLSCRSRDASTVRVFLADLNRKGAGARVFAVRRGGARTVWRGTALYGRIGTRHAYLAGGSRGDRLLRVSLATGRATTLARVPPTFSGVWLRPDGREVALTSRLRLTVVRVDGRRPPVRRTRLVPCCVERAVWLEGGRMALLTSSAPTILDARLRRVGRVRGWFGSMAVARAGRLVGINYPGRLTTASAVGGTASPLRELPGPTVFALAAVPPPS